MQVVKTAAKDAKLVLTGMITSRHVVAQVSAKWDREGDGLFGDRYMNRIGTWCIKYFDRYNTAPKDHIQNMFESWASAAERDEGEVKVIARVLRGLSDAAPTKTNAAYVLDTAAEYFNRVALERLRDSIDGDLARGDMQRARKRVDTFDEVRLASTQGTDVLQSAETIRNAFERQAEVLFNYPDALGNFFGRALCRDGFISFMAPEKRGKSFWLIDMAWRAMLARQRTVFFSVGDMSEAQMFIRFGVRASGHPKKPGTLTYPVGIDRTEEDIAEPDHRTKDFKEGLTWQGATDAMARVAAEELRSDKSFLKLYTYPSNSVNVSNISNDLATLCRTGWVPDVVVVDYADILAPMHGNADTREQINQTWASLRGMSQKYHCLVITATQSDAASYGSRTLSTANFSEDKRKLAHVTGMAGINQTESEKELGLYRLNWVVLREDEFISTRCVHVAGCLGMCQPAMYSIF